MSRSACEAKAKEVYNRLHPSFSAAFFASRQTLDKHVNDLKTALHL